MKGEQKELKKKQLLKNTDDADSVKLIYNYFIKHIHEKYPGFWNDYIIYRLYINIFAPKETAYFHTDSVGDSDQWTFLYYPNKGWDYKLNDGGWTELFLDEKIIGVIPVDNTLCTHTWLRQWNWNIFITVQCKPNYLRI